MTRAALWAFAALVGVLLVGAPAAAQDPTPADEWVDAEYDVRFQEIPATADETSGGPATVTLEATLAFHEVNFEGRSASADEVRDGYEDGSITDQQIDNFEQEITSEFESKMATLLPLEGGPTVPGAETDMSTLEGGSTGGDAYHPPILVNVSGEGVLDLAGVAGSDVARDDLALALELGASFDVPADRSAEPGWNTTTRLHAPDGLAWTEAEIAQVEEDGQVATTQVQNWKGTELLDPVDGSVTATNPQEPAYSEEDVDLDVTVDLEGVDVQLTAIPGGSLGEGKGSVTVDGKLAVVELPDSAPDALTETGVTHVAADDIRLLLEEDVVDRSTIEDRLQNVTDGFVGDTPDRVDVVFSGGVVDQSINGTDQEPNETARPVRLEFNADIFVDLALSGGGSGGAQAITLHSIDRSFTFPSLQDFATTYQVILPKGLSLQDVQVQDGEPPTMGTTEDGRDQFTLSVDEGEEQEATVQAAVTASFLWHQATELVVLLILLFLIPIAIVAYLLLRSGGDEDPKRVEEPPAGG